MNNVLLSVPCYLTACIADAFWEEDWGLEKLRREKRTSREMPGPCVNINVILTQLKLLQNSVIEFHSFIFYEMLSL